MAFPTTAVLDNFNRTENPLSDGGKWTGGTWGSTGVLATNGTQVYYTGTSSNPQYYRNDQTYGPDCEVYCTVAVKPGSNSGFGWLHARIQQVGSAAADGYVIRIVEVVAGTDTVEIYRLDNGSFTLLGSAFSQELAAGDSVGFEAVGSTLSVYYKASAGSWTSLGSRTDTTYASAGYIGIGGATNTAFRLDDFGGGTVATGQSVNVSGKTSAAAFGSVVASPGGVNVPVTGLGSSAAFGAVAANSGGVLVDVAGLGSAAAFGAVTPAPGNRDVAVAGLGSAAAFGSVATDGASLVNVPGLTSAAQFGSVSPSVGGVNVPVSGLTSAAQFGSVSTTGGAAPTDLNPAARGYYF